ncbi:hypothetical protein V3C99_007791, partial [Haemonchus contortus]|uniref:DDE Tnp4 domain-containing protein n=1 Tax=Haemonchus contortus TaxID=6289 RepID=A0A912MRB9_HAECO
YRGQESECAKVFDSLNLRYVGHGYTFSALAKEVQLGISTVQSIVYEVASAVRSVLYREAFPPLTRQQLEYVAAKTSTKYDYPRAEGFMDGNHINIKSLPTLEGPISTTRAPTPSYYSHYIVDSDHRILAFDVGAPGRVGDAGVYMRSNIKTIPETTTIICSLPCEGNVGLVQYHIMVDCGFAQEAHFVRPYTRARANTPSKRRFNAKHKISTALHIAIFVMREMPFRPYFSIYFSGLLYSSTKI